MEGRPYPGNRSEIAQMRAILEEDSTEEVKFRESTKRDKRFGNPEKIKNHILDVYNKIDEIKPRRGASQEQKQELKEAKKKFFTYLLEALESARQYHNIVVELEKESRKLRDQFADEETKRELREETQESDLRRRRKHNAMMDKMRLAMRLGRWYFDKDFNPDEIEKEELREKIENPPYEKIKIPKNIFTPRDVELGVRQEWGDLGEAVYEAFVDESELLKQIKESIKK
jgi:hypothetical protein